MTARIDFLQLYDELGLGSGASLDDLKRAYRRRVSELHPDRRGDRDAGAAGPVSADHLQQLTAMYGAATAFHRRHGRLPGSVGTPGAVRNGTSARPADAFLTTPPPPSARAASRPARPPLLLVLALVAAGGAWIAFAVEFGDERDALGGAASDVPSSAPPSVATAAAPAERSVETPRLELGMRPAAVLALEGEPVARDSYRWDYGPSWIAFERGRISDWYSSPMRPLKSATTRPPPLN